MNYVEFDLPLSEWAGQLAGAVSSVFLRRFPDYEMPSEEVAAMVDKFMACPPTPEFVEFSVGAIGPLATAAVVEMANEIERLKTQAAEDIIWMSGIGPIPDEALAYWRQISDRWLGTKGKFSTDE